MMSDTKVLMESIRMLFHDTDRKMNFIGVGFKALGDLYLCKERQAMGFILK